MNKEQSMSLSGAIGRYITLNAPKIDYLDEDIKKIEKQIDAQTLATLKEAGLYNGDMSLFYVINSFCLLTCIDKKADNQYLSALFKNARLLDADLFENNEYIKKIAFSDIKEGNLLFTHCTYERGEIFQYDMPDFSQNMVVPKLGFFARKVSFPTVYEGKMPWMSVCPSEISTIDPFINKAFGRVLVLGLGLGYYPFRISALNNVSEITVIEINPVIINLFNKHIFDQFPHKNKIKIVQADALDYLSKLKGGEFDYCFADIWEGALDGAPLYKKIKEHEKRLKIPFDYWIKDQIEAFINYT